MEVQLRGREQPVATQEQLTHTARARPGPVALVHRLWGLPVVTHLGALTILLLVLVPVVGTRATFSADEGATIIQARQLARGDGWITPYALERVDPTRAAFPLENSEAGRGGYAPYAKHPVYPMLLAVADRAAGVAGMVMLSVLGTAAAAAFAALLAQRWAPPVAKPTLWVVGIGSPLLFDSYLVIAHTLAAAAAAAAVWCALELVDRGSVVAVCGAIAAIVASVLLRTEALLFAASLAMALGTLAVARRSARLGAVAVTIAGAGAITKLVEPRLARWLAGAPSVPVPPSTLKGHGYVDDRMSGFVTTWLSPGYGTLRTGALVVFALAAVLVTGAAVARARPRDSGGIALLAGVAIVLAVVVRGLEAPGTIPGLVVAFPLLFAGLVTLRRDSLRELTPRVLLATWAGFSVAVLATQYYRGGSDEWGGRYFALGLPIVCPVALEALRVTHGRLDGTARRLGVAAVAVTTVVLAAAAVENVRISHERTEVAVTTAARVSAVTPAGDGGSPVIVTYDSVLPRSSWRIFDERRFLLPPESTAGRYLARLRRAGVTGVVFATRDSSLDLGTLTDRYVVDRIVALHNGSGWRFAVLRGS